MTKENEFKRWTNSIKEQCVNHDENDFEGFEELHSSYKPDIKSVTLVFNYCRKGYGDSHSTSETIYFKRKNDRDGFKVISSHISNNDRNMGYERDKKPEDIVLKKVTQDFMFRNHFTFYEPCFKDLNNCRCQVGKDIIDVSELKFMKGIRELTITIETWYD